MAPVMAAQKGQIVASLKVDGRGVTSLQEGIVKSIIVVTF